MRARSETVQRTFSLGGIARGPVIDQVRGVARDAGYRSARSALDHLIFTRVVRPRWATILGWSLAITGVGLMFLLVRTTESFDVRLSDETDGLRMTLTGVVAPELLAILERRFGAARALRDLGGLESAPSVWARPAAAEPAEPRPPTTVAVPECTTIRGGQFRTAVAPVRAANRFTLVCDDDRLEVTGRMLIGRDPEARPGEEDATRVRLDDTAVSKTHLLLGIDAGGLWVLDRRSTNGTVVVGADGVPRTLVPDQADHLGHGAQIRLGACTITVEES